MLTIGGRYKFNYPTHFTSLPEYSAHRGQIVMVTRACVEPEVDFENGPDGDDPMYGIQADDGWTGVAWTSELEKQ